MSVDGCDETGLFFKALSVEGFQPTTVKEAPVRPGERAPAFLVRDGWAEFGWVFWEKFREGRARKLFGSVRRNAKGDWEVQIGSGSPDRVYMNLDRRASVDSDRPSEF